MVILGSQVSLESNLTSIIAVAYSSDKLVYSQGGKV